MSRQVVQNKPTAAFALSIVGGVMALIAGFVLILLAAVFSSIDPSSFTSNYYSGYYTYFTVDFTGLVWILGAVGAWMLVASIVLLFSAVKLNSNPLEHSKWGAIILVFSIFGGNIFGIIGGALALSYKPQILESNQLYMSQATVRYCPNCGQPLDANSRFCPHCGKQIS